MAEGGIMLRSRTRTAVVAALSLTVAVSLGSSAQDRPSAANPAAAEAALAHLPQGYLPRAALPDSLALLPPPPARGSMAMKQDEAARREALKLRGTPRYARAATDAVIGFP